MSEKKEFITKRARTPKKEEVSSSNGKVNDIDIIELDINSLKYNPFQSRFKIDEKLLEDLANDIQKIGLQNPISVSKRGTEYLIISGHRRYEAMKLLGYEKINVILKDEMSNIELISANISENTQRKNISPIEVAFAFLDLKKELGDNRGVAERLGVSEATASNYISMATKIKPSIIEDLKQNTDLRSVNFLTKLSGMPEDLQEEYYNDLKNGKQKIGTLILKMNKFLKEQKQGKTFFEKDIKSLRNKAKIVIDSNEIKIKGKVISFHQNEKEELINELSKVLESFYEKYDKKIKADDKRKMATKRAKGSKKED